jgi:hypothetical protein
MPSTVAAGLQDCLSPVDTPTVSLFSYAAPERLQFREGGGCLSVFGLPFFGAGVFLLLTAGGVLPMGDPGDLAGWGRPLLGFMGVAFTGVGGSLVFGRAWTILDRTEQAAIKSWGLLVPFREQPRPLAEFTRVTIGFEPGDSDSSEHFPVALKARSGPDFTVCRPTAYTEARAAAAEAAKHLGFALEDASGAHPVTLDADDADRPLQQRQSLDSRSTSTPARPAAPRSEVHDETSGVRIVIPQPRLSRLGLVLGLAPLAMPVVVAPWLWTFFEQTRTPEPVGLAFLGMLVFLFCVLPGIGILNAFLRSRHGYTEVSVSRQGITVRERGAWRTRTVTALDAIDILDVDYGTRESSVASTRHAVEQKLMGAGHDAASVRPRLERLMATAARWTKGRGVIVKARTGLTTFGGDLDDDEIRYLADVVRRAVIARRG